ncbi:MAG: peptidoglycan-associated lipoprotein Pal [Pseudomonadales bacterium]
MTTTTLRGLLAVLFAAFLVAGCGTTEPPPEMPPPPDEGIFGAVPDEPEEPEEPLFVSEVPLDQDAFGWPIDDFGNRLETIAYFDFDESILSEMDIPVLRLHAEFLRKYPDKTIVVEGHCDERGTREYNLALGERRADSVRSFLIANGVSRGQIESVSYGEEQPVDPGHDEIAWAKNRRAEISY